MGRSAHADWMILTQVAIIEPETAGLRGYLSIQAQRETHRRLSRTPKVRGSGMAKRASKTLAHDSEGKYEHLFASTLDGMLVFDAETMKVILANQAAADITGSGSPEGMMGVDIVRSISDGDGNRLAALLANALRTQQDPLAGDVRITTKDGREVWVNAICKKIDYQGRATGLVALRDVTDRKRTEERLLASQERNHLLIENANEAIVVIQDEVLKFANPMTEEIFGCTAQELMLKPMADMIHPEDRQAAMEQHLRRLNGEGVPHPHQFRLVDKAGNTKWVELNGVLLSWGERPQICAL